MSNSILILLIILCTSMKLIASNKISEGDTLFVWAKRGLNLRNEPNIKSKKIKTLEFGEAVEINRITDKSFNVSALNNISKDYYSGRIEPFIIKGNWVQVKTKSGLKGYVISQYLLVYEPNLNSTNNGLIELSKDTTIIQEFNSIHRADLHAIKTKYKGGVELVYKQFGKGYENIYTFENATIGEIVILFRADQNRIVNPFILKNWKNELILMEEGCEAKYMQIKDKVVVFELCSC